MKKLVLFSLLLAAPVWAGIVTGTSGVMVSCTTGCVDDLTPTTWLRAKPGPIVFMLTSTGTIVLQLQQSAHDGADFTDVTSITCSSTSPCRHNFGNAVGLYRWTVDCTGACTYTVKYEQSSGYW